MNGVGQETKQKPLKIECLELLESWIFKDRISNWIIICFIIIV